MAPERRALKVRVLEFGLSPFLARLSLLGLLTVRQGS